MNKDKKENNKKLHTLRTFKTDVSEFIKKEDISLAEIVAKQQEKQPTSFFSPKAENKKTFFIIGLLLCSLVILGGILFFREPDESDIQPALRTQISPPPLLPSQVEKTLNIKDIQDFKNQVNEEMSSSFSAGDFVYLSLKKDDYYLNSKDFLGLLKIERTTGLTQFIEDDFFLGIINLERKHPLVIFEAKDEKYEYVFSEMLQWEKRMVNNLSFILKEGISFTESPAFQDKIIKNQDVRIVRNGEGIVFLYTILVKKYIIITNSQKALEEIINRFVIYKFS